MVPLRRNRDFQLLWGGQAVSLLGSQISKIACPLLVLAMTGSPAKAGVAGFAAMLGYLLFPLPAGGAAVALSRGGGPGFRRPGVERLGPGVPDAYHPQRVAGPDQQRGRADRLGVTPLGSLLAGFLLQSLSPSAAMTVVAAGMAATAVVATALTPIRRAGRGDRPPTAAAGGRGPGGAGPAGCVAAEPC